ncbi:MAG: hemerythrin domain-containing protein [Actinomycetota bacterium]
MSRHPDGPADTTMMGVVHDALRRDIARLQTALAPPAIPDDNRRHALAQHALWMMDFLHDHHRGEDEGLWPLVTDRNPQAAELLAGMEAEHALIVPAADRMTAAARWYDHEADTPRRREFAAALDELTTVVLPHLAREEADVMPLVSASISHAEWRDWEHAHNVKGKSPRYLARRAHWLMDGLDPDRYQVLVHLVPPPVRLVIVHGFARSYRRACAARWGAELPVGPARAGLPAAAR